jgi:uncharacterized membrane protein
LIGSGISLTAADLQALLLAMRLICESRLGNKDTSYKILKVTILALKQYGHFSTNFLGAYALLAVYEVGQGILPAAWLSVNGLIGLFCALGIHDKTKAVQVLQRPGKA